ncbi:MAG TPA: trypsin-like peptidase domain-containing protein [Planctomycetaceae bacterium]|nr:trypsin-like peptidase domain-containing protein [Planctomycetaceae bacterium]
MTHRAHSLTYTFLILSAGVVLGLAIEGWPVDRTVQARHLDPSEAERMYSELEVGSETITELGRVMSRIYTLASPSVVHIQSERRDARNGTVEETGSGIIMSSTKSPRPFVVTNKHVIQGASLNEITIKLSDGRVLRPTRILHDAPTDIAILEIPQANVIAGRWGDSEKLEIGNIVLAMGSPFGLNQSITMGIISAKGRRSLRLGGEAASSTVINQDFLQTDAAINPGNSGGPLIDTHGRVIGINTAIASNSGGNEGIGFSIPSNLVRFVVEQLVENGQVKRAFLGVALDEDFTVEESFRLKLDRLKGARVTEVYANTPADRAKLRYNDVILSFDGYDIEDHNHLIHLVSLTPLDKRVRLEILRDGKRANLYVELTDRSRYDRAE